MKKLLALFLAITTVFALPLTACGGSDPNTLNIVCLDAGYGTEWIYDLEDKFEKDNPEYKVEIEALYEAGQLITANINSKRNDDDLYISVGTDWKTYAAKGQLANLDSLLNETVDGVTIKDKIKSEYSESVLYPDLDGSLHTYRLPWTAGVGGIFYNKKMFDTYDWTVPTTYEELTTLCQTIVDADIEIDVNGQAKKVTPFVYTGENTDYFDYTVYTWWAQLAGKTAIDQFMLYGAKENFDADTNTTYGHLKTATKKWYDLFSNNTFVFENSSGYSNDDAQKAFVRGQAAMMFNGEWIYNEILDYKMDMSHFELGFMKTPTVKADAENIIYTIGEDQWIGVPASSSKLDLAKKFIKLIVSDYGCKTFINKAHGLLAYDVTSMKNNTETVEDITSDAFMQNLISVRNSYDKAFTNYPAVSKVSDPANSTINLYLGNQIDIWGTSARRPYQYLIHPSSPKTLNKAFEEIKNTVSDEWNYWKNTVGIK